MERQDGMGWARTGWDGIGEAGVAGWGEEWRGLAGTDRRDMARTGAERQEWDGKAWPGGA